MRLAVIGTAISFLVVSLAGAQIAGATIRKATNIPPQALGPALQALAKDRNFQVVCRADLVEGVTTPGVAGELTPGEALTQLLTDTGLTFRYLDDETVTIIPVSSGIPAGATGEPTADPKPQGAQKQPFWEPFRLAQLDTGQATDSDAVTRAQIETAAVADKGAPAGLEEVVVSAQKRNENIQSVPIAITALSSDTLQKYGVDDSESLTNTVPGLIVSRQNQNSSIFLRGVGILTANPGYEGPVAIYLDGVYQIAMPAQIFEFNNVERIEVLKGPQGTLFGRNAAGGVINILTKTPGDKFNAFAEVGYGDYEQFKFRGYVGGPVSDQVSADFSAVVSRMGEGYGKNLHTGHDSRREPYEDSLRSKVFITPFDDFEITGIAYYNRSRTEFNTYGISPGELSNYYPALPNTPRYQSPGWYDYIGNDAYATVNNSGASVKVQYETNALTLSDQVAVQYINGFSYIDTDAIPEIVQEFNFTTRQRAISNELQLTSPTGSVVEWVGGLYYLKSNSNMSPEEFKGSQNALLGNPSLYTDLPLTSIAPFGQATYEVLPKLELTAGVRYTRDELSLSSFTIPQSGPNAGIEGSRVQQHDSQAKVTYRFALNYQFTDDIMAYASRSRGFKSGTYNIQTPATPVTIPEILDSTEVGLKTMFFDRRLRLNGSLFYYSYQNLVFRAFSDQGVVILKNAANSTVKGVDFDWAFAATNTLQLTGGVGYLNAIYDEFKGAPIVRFVGGYNGVENDGHVRPGDPNGPFGSRVQDLNGDASGNTMIQSPKWTIQVGLQKTFDLGTAGQVNFSANYSYKTATFFGADNVYEQPAYGLLNTTLAYNPNDTYTFRLWAKNLTDRRYILTGGAGVYTDTFIPGYPRTFGGSFSMKW